MKIKIILIISFFTLFNVFGQNSPTKKSMSELFSEKYKSKKHVINDTFYSNFSESEYLKKDTLILIENLRGFKNHITKRIIWEFSSKNKISIVEYNREKEPPTKTYSLEKINLKIKLKKEKNKLILKLSKNGILIDQFIILSLEKLNYEERKLTLLRIK